MKWRQFKPSEYLPVIDAVAREHGIGLRDIVGASRLSHIVVARKQVALRLRRLGMSNPQIATALNRDVSSIDYYVYPRRLERKRRLAEMRQMAGLSA